MISFSTVDRKIASITDSDRGVAWTVAVIAAVAAILRIDAVLAYGWPDYLSWARANYAGVLSGAYWSLAGRLLEDGTYDALFYPPGYPAFIAAIRALSGDSMTALRVIQGVLDAAAVAPLYYVLRWFGLARPFALLGIIFYAVHASFVFGPSSVLGESLAPALWITELALLVHILKTRAAWAAVILGLAAGFHVLVRPDHLFFIGLALVIVLLRFGFRGTGRALLMAAGFVVLLFPWGLHNKTTHGAWLFTTTGGGVALWEGLGILPNDQGWVTDDIHWIRFLRDRGMAWHSIEANDLFMGMFLDAVAEHPGHYLRATATRAWRMLSRHDSQRPRGLGYRPMRLFSTIGVALLLGACWIRRKEPVIALVLALPALHAVVSLAPVHWEPRYTRYLQLSYIAAICVLLDALYHQLRARGTSWAPRLRTGLAALAVFAVLYSVGAWTVLAAERVAALRAGTAHHPSPARIQRATNDEKGQRPGSALYARSAAIRGPAKAGLTAGGIRKTRLL